MAQAYGSFNELSHQLRFLLFEIGIGLSQSSIDYFISLAHKNTLKRLEHAVLSEQLCDDIIKSHHIQDYVAQLQSKLKASSPESQFYQWASLSEQLNESIANEALSLAYKYNWNMQLKSNLHRHGSVWQWLNSDNNAVETFLFLEQWGSFSDPYLPNYFAKETYTRREILQTSPQFQAQMRAHWCSLHKSMLSFKPNAAEYGECIQQAFAMEYRTWREKLLCQHLHPEDYIPIPVHPCHWRKELRTEFAPWIDSKMLILHPNHQSLMPLTAEYMLPSNTRQYLLRFEKAEPNLEHAENQIALHQSTNRILQSMDYYQNSLYINDILTGLQLRDEDGSSKFGVSIHKNPAFSPPESQRVLPYSSLFAHSPLTLKPLLIEILETSQTNPLEFLEEYCDKLLFGQLHLLLKHGIEFDFQQSQPLIIFEKDRPQGILVRDIKQKPLILNRLLEVREYNVQDSCFRFIQNNFIHHLNAWVQCIHLYYQIPLGLLWQRIKNRVELLFEQLPKDLDIQVVSLCKRLILEEDRDQECLLRMSLYPIKNKCLFSTTSNYLALSGFLNNLPQISLLPSNGEKMPEGRMKG